MMEKGKRRPHGTGSIIQLADGRWRGKYKLRGKACYVYAKTKAECNRRLLSAIKEGKRPASPVTFEVYADKWLKKKCIGYKAMSQVNRLGALNNHLLSAFGPSPMADITPDHVQAFVLEKNEALAPTTVRGLYNVIHAIFESAVIDEVVMKSPCRGITLPVVKRGEYTVLTMEQLHLVLGELEGRSIRPIVAMAALMGLRKGELLALRWADINFTNNTVFIHRNVERFEGQFIEDDPKTASSIARLPLIPAVRKILVAHRAEQNEFRLQAGDAWQDKDLVFPGWTGEFRYGCGLDVPFKQALSRAGLPDMRFHDLRHTTASLLIEMGMHPKDIQEIMRHASIKETMDTYGHLFAGRQEDVMGKLNQCFIDARGSEREDQAN